MTKTFSIGSALNEGFRITTSNLGAVLGMEFLVIGAAVLSSVTNFGLPMALTPLVWLLTYVLRQWLEAGWYRAQLHGALTGKIYFNDLFTGKSFILRMIGLSVLISIMGFLAILPMLILMGAVYGVAGPAMHELGTLSGGALSVMEFVQRHSGFIILELLLIGLGIVPPFLVGAYFGFAPYLLVDKDINPIDALSFSAQIAKGAIIPIVNLYVVISLVNLAGFLCLIAGLAVTIPASALAYTCVYRTLLRQTEAHWGGPLGRAGILSEPPRESES